jgi:hypothetical protein
MTHDELTVDNDARAGVAIRHLEVYVDASGNDAANRRE